MKKYVLLKNKDCRVKPYQLEPKGEKIMPELQKNTTIISAAPGWNLIDFPIGEKKPDLIFDPVISWVVTYGSDGGKGLHVFVRPITVKGTWPSNDLPILQRPDGSFTDTRINFFSREDVIAEFQRRIGIMNQPGIAALEAICKPVKG